MTLEQLRIFVAAAELLSMTRAAERLNLTQPAVSAAIAALEARYATRLFDRIGRRLTLTEAGRLFMPEAVAVLARADSARLVLDELSGLLKGEIRIAASQTVASFWLPARMARFVTATPHIQLKLFVGNTSQAAARVLSGEADLAFVEGDVEDDLLAVEPIGGDRIGLFVGPGHPFAERSFTRKDLEAAAWVMRDQGSGTRDHVEAGLRQSGVTPENLRIVLELPSNEAALEAVEGGQLVTAVSELSAACRVGAGAVRQLDWPLSPRAFTMLRHRARTISRAVAAFKASLST
ncbi:LysR substrate-binding domain-containing protein [Caulobacter sp. UC70_42]|uniref:LysR substrate-binding domain-containing protein n=1 Tax=Caulobacter sp. UC70_42 TaxID=3374551 RepID=UPI0037572AB1